MVLGLQASASPWSLTALALLSAHLTFIKAQTTKGTWRPFLSDTGCSEQLTLPQENGNVHPSVSTTVALSLESALHLDHKEKMSPFGMQANPTLPSEPQCLLRGEIPCWAWLLLLSFLHWLVLSPCRGGPGVSGEGSYR